jgi:hypothetical protein
LLAGFISAPRNFERKPTNPIAAVTNTIANIATIVARSQPRRAELGAFGDLSSGWRLM